MAEEKKRRPSSKSKRPARSGKPAADDDDFLADIDLNKFQHEVIEADPEEEEEAAFRASGRRRGPDMSQFYSNAWKDAWKFTKQNKRLTVQTMISVLFYGSIVGGCVFMVTWCSELPPKVFWGTLAFFAAMVTPGWLWYLDTRIISATIEKTDKLKRVNFDRFLNIALGIKVIAWTVATLVQLVLPVAGVGLILAGMIPAGAALIGVGVLLLLLILPLAMVHMTMPITYRGWLPFVMLPILMRNFGAAMYWCLILLTMNLPLLICAGVAGGVYGKEIATAAGSAVYNLDAQAKNAKAAEAAEGQPFDKIELKAIDGKPLIVPGVLLCVGMIFSLSTSVFVMRANGLLAQYCKKNLKLISRVKEKKYVSKAEIREKKEDAKREAKRLKEEAKQKKLEEKNKR